MSYEQKKLLETQLWNIANELCGKMDVDEFRDHILGFIFYKYLSGKQQLFATLLLETESDLLIADTSEDYNDIGKTIEAVNLNNDKVISGLHTFLQAQINIKWLWVFQATFFKIRMLESK